MAVLLYDKETTIFTLIRVTEPPAVRTLTCCTLISVRSINKHVCIMGVDRGQHVNESSKMKHLIIICKQVSRLIGVD